MRSRFRWESRAQFTNTMFAYGRALSFGDSTHPTENYCFRFTVSQIAASMFFSMPIQCYFHLNINEAAHLQCTLCVHHVGLGSSRANIWLDRDPLSCEFLCTPMCFLLWLRRNRIHRRDVTARKHRTVVVKLLWPTNHVE